MVQRCLSPSLSFPTSMEVATVTVPVSVHLLSGSQNWSSAEVVGLAIAVGAAQLEF